MAVPFATEVRKVNGEQYPPKTLHHYLIGIQQHIRGQKSNAINFMTDKEFTGLRKLLDSLYRRLHAQEVGCSAQPTESLTAEDEEKLWTTCVLNQDTPAGLLNCVFFLSGKNVCLQGGAEHRDLKLSQFKREVVKIDRHSRVRYTYREHGLKNRSGTEAIENREQSCAPIRK